MKQPHLNLSLGLLVLLAGASDLQSQPVLGIAPAGNQSVLYWPSGTTNYLVQSATNLAAPVWAPVNATGLLTGVMVSNTAPAGFFRLVAANPPAGMALIPAGSFTMGDTLNDNPGGDETPTHQVYVSAIYMDVNLVTYGFWQTVYTNAVNSDGYTFNDAGTGAGPNYPVVNVDWYDCVKWCNARSQQAGLTPVYYTDAGLTQVYKTGEVTPYVNWAANGYRLPTEEEWEKAARGGLSGWRFPWGNRMDENQANYLGNTNSYSYDLGPNGYNAIGKGGTSPVGSFDVNGYGLYDMAGNVFQWCGDWYGSYGSASQSDPHGPSSGSYRVFRGGSWYLYAFGCRTANRYFNNPGNYSFYNIGLGFRSVLPPGQ